MGFPINECPNCDCDTFYVKQRITGTGRFNFKANGSEEVENSDLHDGLTYKTISKYAYCSECNKRLFEVKGTDLDY